MPDRPEDRERDREKERERVRTELKWLKEAKVIAESRHRYDTPTVRLEEALQETLPEEYEEYVSRDPSDLQLLIDRRRQDLADLERQGWGFDRS